MTGPRDPAGPSGAGPAPEGTLGWGRRYLMCPPTHFGVLYEINPWMHREVPVDVDAAHAQWNGLVAALREAGATVEVIEPAEGVPDMVFSANAGLINGPVFVPARFRHPERQPETPRWESWFRTRGWLVRRLPPGVHHEGAGDALPFGGVLVSGYRFRSDARAHLEVSRLLGVPTRPVELVDPRLYHLDLTFCPLDDRRAMCVPSGWDRYGRRVIAELVPEPLELTPTEALAFVANSVVVDRTVIMPVVPVRVGRILESWGFTPVECPVGEFLKAGGACRCLTLALDVRLGAPQPGRTRIDPGRA